MRAIARRFVAMFFVVLVSVTTLLQPSVASANTVETVVVIGKRPGAQSAWDQFLEFLSWLADIVALIWNALVNMVAPEDAGLLDLLEGYEPPCIRPDETSASWSARASAACISHAMNAASSRIGPLAGPAVTTIQGLCNAANATAAAEGIMQCQ